MNARIESEPGQSLVAVYLWLTKAETRELRDDQADLLQREDLSWHAHVPSAGCEREITIALEA